MLICSECGKVIANTNPSVHYGICSSCPIPHKEDKIEREPTTADEYNDEWLEEQRKDKKECCDECSYWETYITEDFNKSNKVTLTVRSVSVKRIMLDPNMRLDARYWMHSKPNRKGE